MNISEVRTNVLLAEIERLSSNNGTLITKNKNAAVTISRLELEVRQTALRAVQLDIAETYIGKLEDNLNFGGCQLKDVQAQLTTCRTALKMQDTDIEDLREQVSNGVLYSMELKDTNIQLEKEVAKCESVIREKNKAIEDTDRQNDELFNNATKQDNEIQQLRSTIAEKYAKELNVIKEHNKDIRDLVQENTELTAVLYTTVIGTGNGPDYLDSIITILGVGPLDPEVLKDCYHICRNRKHNNGE